MAEQQVFISYAWGGESETVANEVELILRKQGIDLVRDKTDLGFKGLIREFMEKIGQGNFVVLIISDKYLKSKNCMFELMEVERKGEFFDRIFPIVLPDANIYDSLGILGYLKYWDQKIKALNASAKELDNLADTRKVQEDINLYTDIRGAIDDLAGKLSNMNTLTVEIMRSKTYQPLVDALVAQSGKPSNPPQSSPHSKKEGKVLYHIPGMMQVHTWSRCTVRLAWEDIYLTEGLKIPEDQRVIESIRLGNVMQVSLNEGRDGHNFEIKALNNEEQFIFEDDFTEWLFDVKALNMGNFTLILRVTLVQIIEGKERKKDVVLERNVITEAVVPKALAKFEAAEEGLTPPKIPNSEFHSIGKGSNHEVRAEKIYPELSMEEMRDWPSSPSPQTQAPTSFPKPAPTSSLFRKILPYAASVAAIFVVGALFFPRFESQDYRNSSTKEGEINPELAVTDEGGIFPENSVTIENPVEQKMLVTLSLESISPTGEAVYEVMAFVVNEGELASLSSIEPGKFSLQVFPASDSSALNLGDIREFSVLEINDSIQKVASRPIQVGKNLVDRSELQINPGTQIIQTRPQAMDSVAIKKLRKGTFRKIGN